MITKASNHIGILWTISTEKGFIQPAEPEKITVSIISFRLLPGPSQKRTRKVEEWQRSGSEAADESPPPEANVEEDRGQPGL